MCRAIATVTRDLELQERAQLFVFEPPMNSFLRSSITNDRNLYLVNVTDLSVKAFLLISFSTDNFDNRTN